MYYLDHLLECPKEPSLKVLHIYDGFLTGPICMAASLPQFFGAARHPCIEVSECPTGSRSRVKDFAGLFFFRRSSENKSGKSIQRRDNQSDEMTTCLCSKK